MKNSHGHATDTVGRAASNAHACCEFRSLGGHGQRLMLAVAFDLLPKTAAARR